MEHKVSRPVSLVVVLSALSMFVVLVGGSSALSGSVAGYPGPGSTLEPPLPTSQPENRPQPLPEGLEIEAAVGRALEQRTDRRSGELQVAGTSVIDLPLTGQRIWVGTFVDEATRALVEAQVDINKRLLLTGSSVSAADYYGEEARAYADRYGPSLFAAAPEKLLRGEAFVEISGYSLKFLPITATYIWTGSALLDSGRFVSLAGDVNGKPVEYAAALEAEAAARVARFGRMDPQLYYRLSVMEGSEPITVTVWGPAIDLGAVDAAVTAQFPEVGAAVIAEGAPQDREGLPISVDPKKLADIEAAYERELRLAHERASTQVVEALSTIEGKAVAMSDAPAATLVTTVSQVIALNAERPIGVSYIDWSEPSDPEPQLDIVRGAIGVQPAWTGGYIGTNQRVGVLDVGIITQTISHPALQGRIVAVDPSGSNFSDHAVMVAGVIGSQDPVYRGIAPGALIVSSRTNGDTATIFNSLTWIRSQGARSINASIVFTHTASMQPQDRVLDYWVRTRNIFVAVAAGNRNATLTDPGFVRSFGKAYNVMTVAGFLANGTAAWGNDTIHDRSAYENPYIDGQNTPGDRQKPEVVAVADLTSSTTLPPSLFNQTRGTSVASPQVAALAALLFNRNGLLTAQPEAVKAIIMASAVHNIEGDSRLSDRDGVGGIYVSSAMQIFDGRGGYGFKTIANILDRNSLSNPFRDGIGAVLEIDNQALSNSGLGTLYAEEGEVVRATLVWTSNPSTAYNTPGTDLLSTNFDLSIKSPDGFMVPNAASASQDNNYEIVEFIAPKTGNYTMRITYASYAGAESNNLSMGYAWLRTFRVVLPNIQRPPGISAQETVEVPAGYPGPVTDTPPPFPTYPDTPTPVPDTPTPTAASSTCPGSSLIANGCFETGNLASWEVAAGSPVVNAAGRYSGSFGAQLPDSARLDQVFTTVSGASYNVSVRLRIDSQMGTPDWGGMRARVVNGSFTELGSSPAFTIATSPAGQWTLATFSFTANSTQSRIILERFAGGSVTFATSWDEVVVTSAGPTPTPTRTATPTPSTLSYQQQSGRVVMEAETFSAKFDRSGDSWTLQTNSSGYAGSGFMQALPDGGSQIPTGYTTTSPELQYRVNFTSTGTHYVWVRMSAPDNAGDSLHMGLNGAGPTSAQNMAYGSGTYNMWVWTRALNAGGNATLNVAATGVQTVNLWMREDGARIDRILLTTDVNYIPTGTGPAESPRSSDPNSERADVLVKRWD